MRGLGWAFALVAVAGLSPQAAAAAIPPPTVAQLAPAGAAINPIALSQVLVRLNTGDRYGTVAANPACILGAPQLWSGGEIDLGEDSETKALVSREFDKAGFKMAGDPNNLFAASDSEAEYAVAGLVKAMNLAICFPLPTADGTGLRGKGTAEVAVEWQIYSRLRREVVARVQVNGTFELKQTSQQARIEMIMGALADSVRGLINSDAFRQAALAAPRGAGAVARADASTGRAPIEFTKPNRKPAALPDVVGSVVTVISTEGHGSGFLISDDGYILTNQHVTGGAKRVRLRWSDRFESDGEVVREDKGRDVALIKTDGRGRTPLTLHRGAPEVGLEVYAIGSPLDEALQGTVTRGIVSTGNRVFDNYSYIQSDVTVNPGNSGGPLVTRDGEVLGLTVLGLRPNGVPSGINLFIPAGDAMDFLGLK